MSTIWLAKPENFVVLDQMVGLYHAFEDIETSEEHRERALMPLLEGSPHGAIWMIGPRISPVGYVAITFGWSIEFGGLEGVLDEIYIREKVRGRGMGREALIELLKLLREYGVTGLTLEVDQGNTKAETFYRSLGFVIRDKYHYMGLKL